MVCLTQNYFVCLVEANRPQMINIWAATSANVTEDVRATKTQISQRIRTVWSVVVLVPKMPRKGIYNQHLSILRHWKIQTQVLKA